MTVSLSKTSKYESIHYTFCANPFIPSFGNLNFIALNYSARIVCRLNINTPLISDYKEAQIIISYKQVKAKNARKGANTNLLLRDDIENDIVDFIKICPTLSNYDQTRILVLNDKTLDSGIGDTGIQGLVSLEKHDGSHDFLLCPGSALKQLTEMVGLGVFDCENIEEVLNSIINELTEMILEHIIPNAHIQLTDALKADIIRYLRFFIYYE